MAFTFTNNSATIDTSEFSLPGNTSSGVPTSQTTDGIYQFFIDFGAMTVTESYRVRLYEKCDSGGTQRKVAEWVLTGAQADPMFVTPSFMLGEGWDCTVLKLAGTARSIPWSIRKVS